MRRKRKEVSFVPISEARKRANQKYIDKQGEIKVRVSKERKAEIRIHAQAQGESVNGFINRAIQETMERDNAASGAAEGRAEVKQEAGE